MESIRLNSGEAKALAKVIAKHPDTPVSVSRLPSETYAIAVAGESSISGTSYFLASDGKVSKYL